MAANNLAFTYILIGKRELLEQADYLSAIAFGSCPWEYAIKGTRGSVLVELGKLDEGIALLKDSFQKTDYAKGKASNAAYLAFAESRKGNRSKAEQYIEIAAKFDPECPLLQRARRDTGN